MKHVLVGSPCEADGFGEQDGAGDAFRMFLLDEAAVDAQLRGKDVIQLTLGISELQPRTSVLEAIAAATRDPVVSRRVCPAGLPELRNAISYYYRNTRGVTVPPQRIVVDAGTSSILRNLFQLIARPGDEILIPRPSYPLYRFAAMLAGACCRSYGICLDTMRVDVSSLAAGITNRTRALVLNSPGNPLGNVISASVLSEIVGMCPPDICIVFDEIYDNVHFAEPSVRLTSVLLSDPTLRGRTVVTNSLSKGYRMYTRRIGWCVLPDALVRPMTIIQQHTRLTVDPAVQLGAVEALKHPDDVSVVQATHRMRWEYARRRLSELTGVRLLQSAGGFYCVLDCRQFMAERGIANCLQLAQDILTRASVAVVPTQDFDLPGMLRLSFTSARFDEAIDRLCSYFHT